MSVKRSWSFTFFFSLWSGAALEVVQRFSRVGPRGRAREWATLGVHPLTWLLSNNWLEEVCGTLTKGTFSSRLLLSNQDKGCTRSVAHSLPPGFCSTCQLFYIGPSVRHSWPQIQKCACERAVKKCFVVCMNPPLVRAWPFYELTFNTRLTPLIWYW